MAWATATRSRQDVAFEPGVAERAAWVEAVDELDEVGVTRVPRRERSTVDVEDLSPVRTGFEATERGFEAGHESRDVGACAVAR